MWRRLRRGGAVCHISIISAGPRRQQRQAFILQPCALSLPSRFKVSEARAGSDGAGVFVAQGVEASGGQVLLFATDALYFADPGFGVRVGQSEKLVAGLCEAVFHSQPVQLRVLGMLLARINLGAPMVPLARPLGSRSAPGLGLE